MTLRELIVDSELLMVIGAWDAISAKLAHQAGAKAVYLSGSCVSTSIHGGPDIGLTTMTEMAGRARQISMAIPIPVVADADTGYGNEFNVRRTVREYERSGVAAIQFEDQEFPKRCGHFDGKSVISAGKFATKIKAAVDARGNDEFLIIARTDAIAVEGIDDAIKRARLYKEAGADIIFIEAPLDRFQMKRITTEAPHPLLANMAAKGRTPATPASELADLGFDLAIYPSDAFKASLQTIREVYECLIEDRHQEGVLDRMMDWGVRDEVTGMNQINDLESDYETTQTEYRDRYVSFD